MIDLALDFICDEINNYLRLKPDLNIEDSDNTIVLYNVSQLGNETSNPGANAFITLINMEEDRISKSPEKYIRNTSGGVTYRNPKIFLNLYLLFSFNQSQGDKSYNKSLKQLSYIIKFFQYQNVFTPLTNPSLPAGIDELIFDLYTTSFQDLNNLWGILGSKYLPSVMYKMRLIVIDENFAQGGAGLISKISINDKTINQ